MPGYPNPTFRQLFTIPPTGLSGQFRFTNPSTGRTATIGKAAGQAIQVEYSEGSGIQTDTPPDPGSGEYPEWWPSGSDPSFSCGSAAEVDAAFDALDGVGGFLTLENETAIAAFVNKMEYGGLRGSVNTRVVIQTSPGQDFTMNLKNLNGDWAHLCFYGIDFEPASHSNTIAVRMFGPHDNIMWMDCNFGKWKQVMEAKSNDPDVPTRYPTNIDFLRGAWTGIYNSSSPVQTPDNANDKSYRSQGAWFQGRNWSFEGITFTGIGWNIAGDATRTKTDQFSQIIYVGQHGQDISITNCIFDGAANNAILCKGTNITVTDCIFDRVTNAIGFGTNESPQFSCSALVTGCEIKRLIPLNVLDDPDLDDDEQIKADSGVAFSILNVDGVTIQDCEVTGVCTGRRESFLMINNGKSTGVKASSIVVSDCDTGDLKLGEVRNFRLPPDGLEVACTNIDTDDAAILVRNTIPSDPEDIVAEFTLDGEVVETQ